MKAIRILGAIVAMTGIATPHQIWRDRAAQRSFAASHGLDDTGIRSSLFSRCSQGLMGKMSGQWRSVQKLDYHGIC